MSKVRKIPSIGKYNTCMWSTCSIYAAIIVSGWNPTHDLKSPEWDKVKRMVEELARKKYKCKVIEWRKADCFCPYENRCIVLYGEEE